MTGGAPLECNFVEVTPLGAVTTRGSDGEVSTLWAEVARCMAVGVMRLRS